MPTANQSPSSQIAMFNGLHQFFSLDAEVIDGVLDLSLSDPTYLCFRPHFEVFSELGGLFGKESSVNSALSFLNRIGETKRHDALETAMRLLDAIQNQAWYVFESIDGLQDVWKRNVTDVNWKEKTVSLRLTESIDWRATSIMSLIRYATYDFNRMVYVLPKNLRAFNMAIYVTELRIFQETYANGAFDTSIQDVLGISEADFGHDRAGVFNNAEYNSHLDKYTLESPLASLQKRIWGDGKAQQIQQPREVVTPDNVRATIEQGPYVLFGLGDCEFKIDSGSSFFESFDNTSDPSMRKSNMVIEYGTTEVKEHMPRFGVIADISVPQTSNYQAAEKVASIESEQQKMKPAQRLKQVVANKAQFKSAINAIANQAKDALIDYAKEFAEASSLQLMAAAAQAASTKLVSKMVGNAYDMSAADLLQLANPNNAMMKVRQGLLSLAKASGGNPALLANDSNTKALNMSPVLQASPLTRSETELPQRNVYESVQQSKPRQRGAQNVFESL